MTETTEHDKAETDMNETDMNETDINETVETGSAAGTFHASREELLGDRPLLGSAEIARSYCAIADRVLSVVAITPGRIRRVDCWLGGVGFVSHAAANDTTRPLLGSVCDREQAVDLTGSIVGSLTGGLPDAAANATVDLGPIGAVGPDALPGGVEWIVIVSSNRTDATTSPQRVVVAGARGGLVLSPLRSLDEPVHLDPVTPEELHGHLAQLVGPPPRSVSELLGED